MIAITDPGAAVPSFDEPLDMLNACHDKVRHFCAQLERLQACLSKPQPDPGVVNSAIDGIVRYFDLAGPQHHADEEQELFPLLRFHEPSSAPVLEKLRNEHVQLSAHWQRARAALLALREGDISLLDHCDIPGFARAYREHATFEEAWLFPAAARWLDAEARYNAGRRMAARRHAPPKPESE